MRVECEICGRTEFERIHLLAAYGYPTAHEFKPPKEVVIRVSGVNPENVRVETE
jgi:hypothetical protein